VKQEADMAGGYRMANCGRLENEPPGGTEQEDSVCGYKMNGSLCKIKECSIQESWVGRTFKGSLNASFESLGPGRRDGPRPGSR